MIRELSKCTICDQGTIRLVLGDYPYNIDHLKCDMCDSTFVLEYEVLWQEDVNRISSEVCDFVQEKLRKYMIQLSDEKENKLFDFISDLIDEKSLGYKHHN